MAPGHRNGTTVKTRERTSGVAPRRVPTGATRGDRPKLLDVLDYREGEPITRADRIIDDIRRQLPIETACKAAGVDVSTFRRWLGEGARVAAERAAMDVGEVPWRKLAKRDEAAWWFHQQIDQALAIAERRVVVAVDALATGEGLTQAVITRELVPKDPPEWDAEGRQVMVEVKRVEKRNRVLPDLAAAKFVLQNRHRASGWGSTDQLESLGSGPAEVHHTHSVPALESLLDQLADRITKPIDTSASEIPPLGGGED